MFVYLFNRIPYWTRLVVQRLGICLLMQGTRVGALVWGGPTCWGAAVPRARAPGPTLCGTRSPRAAAAEQPLLTARGAPVLQPQSSPCLQHEAPPRCSRRAAPAHSTRSPVLQPQSSPCTAASPHVCGSAEIVLFTFVFKGSMTTPRLPRSDPFGSPHYLD